MAVPSGKIRWGDTLDEEDANYLPPTTTTGPDSRGLKTVVEYKKNEQGETVKITTRTRVVKIEKKQYEVRNCEAIILGLALACCSVDNGLLKQCLASQAACCR